MIVNSLEGLPKNQQSPRGQYHDRDSLTVGTSPRKLQQNTTVEVIKSSVDKFVSLTDNASEGTNRISANRLHKS